MAKCDQIIKCFKSADCEGALSCENGKPRNRCLGNTCHQSYRDSDCSNAGYPAGSKCVGINGTYTCVKPAGTTDHGYLPKARCENIYNLFNNLDNESKIQWYESIQYIGWDNFMFIISG